MIILVPSVHHTGTKLVFKDILRGLPEINQQDYTEHETGKIRIHIDEPFLEDLHYWLKRVPAIVPLLHPRKVASGWKVRFKRREELGEQWNWLKTEIDPYDPYYLPIDHEDRDRWLGRIGKALGLKLATGWPVIGKCEDKRFELDDKDEYLVNSWMDDGFFDRFDYER